MAARMKRPIMETATFTVVRDGGQGASLILGSLSRLKAAGDFYDGGQAKNAIKRIHGK